jgi:transcription elongation factor
VVTVDYAEKTFTVFFAQGSSTLTDEQKAELDKISAGAIVDIIATASPEGTKKFNQKLSEDRAAVVKDYLVSRGVNIKSAEGKGVLGKNSNRVAIVKIFE